LNSYIVIDIIRKIFIGGFKMTQEKEYKRKAKRTGNSIQATIPKEIANQLEIREGDTVVYKVDKKGEVTIQKEKSVADQLGVEDEFLSILQEGISEYHSALENLVER